MNIPRATYRIQFTPSFGFSQAKEIVSYLADLGVSHLYASPIFKAHKGSAHGYDIVDPGQLNPELGAAEVFRELVEELKGRGILWLQDIVPNHVAFDSDNEMLMDVLENGRDSAYFHFFDIDWNHPYENLRGRLLAPFLGKFYAEALEDGEIRLEYDEKGMTINYYQLRMPLKVQSYVEVLESRITHLEEKLTGTNPDFTNLLGIIHLFKTLASPQGNIQQSEQVGHAKKMLWLLYSENAAIRQFIDENILLFNGERGKPESFDILDKLISSQLFRLSFWKVASEEINYRRFFTINELISVRVEDKFVFNHTHRLIFQLVREGVFDGLRVDHIDGLYDPTSYLKHLRKRAGDIYIVAEKILASSERLPVSWPIQGSTGYDFMNYVNRIFCKGESQKAFFKLYRSFTGMTAAYEDLVCEKKRTIISKHLAGNIDNLAHLLKKISSHDKYGRDITLYGLRRALVEVMAMCGVYRTYVNQEGATAEDMQYLAQAIQRTHQRLPGFFYEVNFIEKFLLLRYNGHVSEELKKQWIDFVMNFQQYTAPLMAKGFEDTVLYVFAPLLSLNEVGGDPTQFGCTLEEFHDFIAQGPGMRTALNATATHDTKRGEDVRARINVLSEFSQEWEQHLKAWAKLNKKKKKEVHGTLAPDDNEEYFLYQTLLGALPFEKMQEGFKDRMREYIVKAVREAKRHTAWIKPDTAYEEACVGFFERISEDTGNNAFMQSFLPFQKKLAFYGIINSLSQTLLKLCAPGIPDFYQGTELWDLSLVDPDNRRQVDFSARKEYLSVIRQRSSLDRLGLLRDLWEKREDGRIKLFLIYQGLQLRNSHVEVFAQGEYIPLSVEGVGKDHLVVFLRKNANASVICIAPRLLSSLVPEGNPPLGEEIWKDTAIILPPESASSWKDIFSNEQIRVADGRIAVAAALRYFPVALLMDHTS